MGHGALSLKEDGPYDCVVPLSGGKDSVYVLYYTVKKLGLRAIAVSYDNGFVHEVAIRNMNVDFPTPWSSSGGLASNSELARGQA